MPSPSSTGDEWIFFSSPQLGLVGWRELETADSMGDSNIVTLAVAAQFANRGATVRVRTASGQIVGISTL